MDTVHVEVDGIPVDVMADSLDDFEMLDWLADMKAGNILVLPKFARRLFGEEQFANVLDSLRGSDGVSKSSDVAKFTFGCLAASAEAKKAELKN